MKISEIFILVALIACAFVLTNICIYYFVEFQLPYGFTNNISIPSAYTTATQTTAATSDIEKKCDLFNPYADQFQVLIGSRMYPKIIPLKDNKTINFECLNENNPSKLILFWTPFYDRDDFYYGLGNRTPFINHKCPVYNCELTKDKKRINESDMVVFSMVNNLEPLPTYRNNNQQWVFVMVESPINKEISPRFNDIFNLSATYRLDSDFFPHYAFENQMIWELNNDFNSSQDFLKGKTEFAAAIISNCRDKSNRMSYIEEMKKYVPITIYGKCGIPCPDKFDNGTVGDCKEIISQKYKFYLAFENSLCKDYITEKFFISLRYNIIPVVLGIGDYEKFIPKSAFINALDYETPKKLADYLLYLSKNETEYNSYFKWKRFVRRNTEGVYAAEVCEFCIKLHLDSILGVKPKTIEDIHDFWSPHNDCRHPSDYPQLTQFQNE